MGKYDEMTYQFDWSKPSTRWALAEVAKCMQHIANISCLPKEEMEVSRCYDLKSIQLKIVIISAICAR
jgi:hypothetical protein